MKTAELSATDEQPDTPPAAQTEKRKTLFTCMECWPRLCRCPDRDDGDDEQAA